MEKKILHLASMDSNKDLNYLNTTDKTHFYCKKKLIIIPISNLLKHTTNDNLTGQKDLKTRKQNYNGK